MVAAGSGRIKTSVAELAALQPFASVMVTEYEPAAETAIDWVAAPFDHAYE